MSDRPLVCVGLITSPHGVKGAVKVKTFTEKPENIFLYGELMSMGESCKICSFSVISDNLLIATIRGVNSLDEAKLLRHKRLYVEKNKLPILNDENEFYQSDLISMEVRIKNNKLYGYVESVHNFNSGDILEISVIGTKRNIMLSFTKEIFPNVNIVERFLELNMPEFID